MMLVVVTEVGEVKGAERTEDAAWRRAMAWTSPCGSAPAKFSEKKARERARTSFENIIAESIK